eukprot:5677697-Amphidinium_carterae.1
MLKKPNAPQRASTGKPAPAGFEVNHALATPVTDTATKPVSIASLYGLEAVPDDDNALIDLASPVE